LSQLPAVGATGVQGVARVFVGALIICVSGSIAERCGAPVPSIDLAYTVVVFAAAVVCAYAMRAELGPLLRLAGGWRAAVSALAGFGAMLAFAAGYFRALDALGVPSEPVAAPYLHAGWPRWTVYATVALAPGVLEELVFRGYVMSRLDRLLSAHETLLVQAALFSMLHFRVAILPSHFIFGLVFGVLRRRTGSLYPGMAVHVAWNGTVISAEMAGWAFP